VVLGIHIALLLAFKEARESDEGETEGDTFVTARSGLHSPVYVVKYSFSQAWW